MTERRAVQRDAHDQRGRDLVDLLADQGRVRLDVVADEMRLGCGKPQQGMDHGRGSSAAARAQSRERPSMLMIPISRAPVAAAMSMALIGSSLT